MTGRSVSFEIKKDCRSQPEKLGHSLSSQLTRIARIPSIPNDFLLVLYNNTRAYLVYSDFSRTQFFPTLVYLTPPLNVLLLVFAKAG